MELKSTAQRPSSDYKMWFCDLDSTVRHGYDELGRFVNTPDDVVIFPEAKKRILDFTIQGVVVGITNQGGVGLGHMTEQECVAALERTHELLEQRLYGIMYCPHSPQYGCWCRKPSPGMIFGALAQQVEDLGYDPSPPLSDMLFIGDRPEDAECARRAGVDFRVASEWRAGD